MYSISTLLTRNLQDVFGENDPARRRAAIDELFTEDGVFYDPNSGPHRGRDEIDRVAGAIRATHPDFRYQPIAEPEELGNGGRLKWVAGRAGEAPAYAGTDFIIVQDGRIAAVYLFFEESLLARQDIPLIAFSDGTIIDGERRWRAAQLKGRIKTLDVVITDQRMTPSELRVFQITSSVHRASLSGYEMWRACVDLLALNPTFQMKDLAAHLQMEASSITRYLSPSKCVAAWQEALKAGKVGVSDCYEASKLPEAEQPALLALKLSGASRNDLAAIGKKARNAATPAVKVSNIKVALVGGITIVIKGEGIDLEQGIESLGVAMKEMKKAVADGLDARTAQSVWRDKAKAGL